jgi:hypothetical protein
MDIQYLNTDLEIRSKEDLTPIITAFGKNVFVLHHGPMEGMHHAAFELSSDSASHDPIQATSRYCDLVENLPTVVRQIWDNCAVRVIDIGIESGLSPRYYRFEVPESTMERVAALGANLAVTIYAMQEEKKLI